MYICIVCGVYKVGIIVMIDINVECFVMLVVVVKFDIIIDGLQEDVVVKVMEFINGCGVDVIIIVILVNIIQEQVLFMVVCNGCIFFFGGLFKMNLMIICDLNLIYYC